MGFCFAFFSARFAWGVIIRRDFRVNSRNLNIVIDPSNHYLTNRIGRAGTSVITACGPPSAGRHSRGFAILRFASASPPAHRNRGRYLTFVYNNHSHLQNR
ncbi:conserved hypothetical protein [Burkholderia cenocepacia HI2424]|uniref:Uncharacterized protein n=2 Tax=Burkholderia cepacia complex TaxID=87882 RepID=A0A427NZM8_9BURK|nr:conserved hypothetical protein [Burkholderia cenocepacia HI2424]PNO76349.1 hypothetical protein DK10_005280 [Burkholderia cenocepacia]RSC12821.1 hypothetical protein EGT41_05370 [Burkholderia cenocepacia]